MTSLPPIRREVLVKAEPDRAFEVFTARIGDWWPVGTNSVHGEGGSVSFEDGDLVERSAAGERSVWGTVTRWEPPSVVSFTWHPGHPGREVTEVTVSFAAAGEQTLVTLEHRGWEVYEDPATVREGYDTGWQPVLRCLENEINGQREDTWVALLHTPGPAAPAEGLLEAPLFGEHVAFLGRMLKRGYLVAAGAFGDTQTEGMTVLRLPGPDALAEATRLATEDDLSVASGFFAVRIRPWQVTLQA
jgi:uncharacterized protein YndB with AHSA1/START domain/uncharacterized protein YciI